MPPAQRAAGANGMPRTEHSVYDPPVAGRLSREAFERGEPCPSCSRPVLPDLPSLCLFDVEVLRGHRDDPQRLRALQERGLIKVRPTSFGRMALKRQTENDAWLGQHRSLPEHPPSASWGVSDDRGNTGPLHCIECCPPPPPSEEQLRAIMTILRKPASTRT